MNFYTDDEAFIYDGVLLPGMTRWLESYVGEVGRREAVTLEQQILIVEEGHRVLSTFSFEEALLGWSGWEKLPRNVGESDTQDFQKVILSVLEQHSEREGPLK